MVRGVKQIPCMFCIGILLWSCGSSKNLKQDTPPEITELAEIAETLDAPPATALDSIKNTVWQLVEIRIGCASIVLNRELMQVCGMEDYFTLQFTEEGISGKAAPNRYFAPYQVQESNNVKIRSIAGTRIESTVNLIGLTEQGFYDLLQMSTHWDCKDGILDVYAPGETEGAEVCMVFTDAGR